MVRALALTLLVACGASPQPPPPAPERYVPQEDPNDRVPPPPVDTRPTPADPMVARIDEALAVVSALRATDCVNDAQAQIATARRSAEDRRTQVRGAMDRRDDDVVKYELAILNVLADRASQLAADARACP